MGIAGGVRAISAGRAAIKVEIGPYAVGVDLEDLKTGRKVLGGSARGLVSCRYLPKPQEQA
jgi:hypothetical protein